MITSLQNAMHESRPAMRGGRGTVELDHWFKPEHFGAKVRLCTRMTLPPGASVGNHTHDAEDEVYIVLAGSGRILEADKWRDIHTGDAILTGKGGSHSVENNTDEPLVIAAIIMQYA